MSRTNLEQVESLCGSKWVHLSRCAKEAELQKARIREMLGELRLVAPDTAFVVVGSLARGEWTAKSDLDWMLLVDGQVDEAHLTTAQRIRAEIANLGFPKPGPTGVFGGPIFSHELVHHIGGEGDSNKNTTRRVLLLLESSNVGAGDYVRSRVITQLLKRYVEDDYGYRLHKEPKPYVPRFLLNDIARYWRIMAVDFAAKRREREGEGWALKRFKLRMSRKLIFAAGLVTCLSCSLRPGSALSGGFESDDDFCSAMTAFLLEATSVQPLEVLARAALTFKGKEAAATFFGAYDEFLQILDDDESRVRLENLDIESAAGDPLVDQAHQIGERFQEGLSKFFLGTDPALTANVQRYGVF